MSSYRLLSVVAATGRLGFVYLVNGTPYDWGLSVKASKSAEATYKQVAQWIKFYGPDFVITERIISKSRKGKFSRRIADAIARAAQDANAKWALAVRQQTYANKYDEAEALVDQFPDMKGWLPKRRRLWESEPRRMIVFEALALALGVLKPEPTVT